MLRDDIEEVLEREVTVCERRMGVDGDVGLILGPYPAQDDVRLDHHRVVCKARQSE